MKRNVISLFGIFLLIVACIREQDTKISPVKFDVIVKRDSMSQRASYAIIDSVESTILQAYPTDSSKGLIIYRYKGNTPLPDQLPKLDTLFYTIFNDSMNNFSFTTIAWGRLSSGFKKDYTLSKRLVLFAENSDNWNAKQGSPVSGHVNDFVRNLKDDFSKELNPLLKKYNYEIESISVEKVLVGPAEKLIFWDQIKSDVDPEDKLPFDCQLWFLLRKTR